MERQDGSADPRLSDSTGIPWLKQEDKSTVIVTVFLLIFSVSLLYSTVFAVHPMIAGDGGEYLGMTISLFNHASADLQREDIRMRDAIVEKNNVSSWLGVYEKSPDGLYYSSHFFMYSLLNVPLFAVLHFFQLNELTAYQVMNACMLIFALCTAMQFSPYQDTRRVWLILISAVHPVLLYVFWPSTEVYSYALCLIAVVFLVREWYALSAFASALAALQAPPIIVLTLGTVALGLYTYFPDWRRSLVLLLAGSVSSFYYIFYLTTFNAFSLQVQVGDSSAEFISIEKVLSLFLDLNFGLIVYMPLILGMAAIVCCNAVLRRDFHVIAVGIAVLLMVFLATTTINWNCGMMYIHRYAVWLAPLVLLVALYGFDYFPAKVMHAVFAVSVLVSASIVGCAILDYDGSNYTRFNSISASVLSGTPSLYSPPPEVFMERALGAEVMDLDRLPILLYYDGNLRKALIYVGNSTRSDALNRALMEQFGLNTIDCEGFCYLNSNSPTWAIPSDPDKFTSFYRNPVEGQTEGQFPALVDGEWHGLEAWNRVPNGKNRGEHRN